MKTTKKTREQELMDQFKDGLDPAGAAALTLRVEALEAAQAGLDEDLGRERTEWDAQRESLVADAASAIVARDKAEGRVKTLESQLTKAKAKVVQGAAPAKPRALKSMEGPAREFLHALIRDAERVEIAFSDGTAEIAGVNPVVAEGEVWREHPLGLMLRDPVTIQGPTGAASIALDGYALILDGKQVAYTKRSDALPLGPGQKVTLADDIYF
jgi:hypothetical protein